MGTKTLTLNQKARWTPIIIERDYSGEIPACFYCGQEFIENDPYYAREWEHLNNNDQDNRPENLAWAHARCNERKKNNPEWQVLAAEKLKKNLRWHYESLGEGGGEKSSGENMHTNEQIEANKTETKLAEEYLVERLLPRNGKPAPESELDFNDTKESLAYVHYKKYGHGSSNTFDRILRILTSPAAPFAREKKDGRLKIARREGR